MATTSQIVPDDTKVAEAPSAEASSWGRYPRVQHRSVRHANWVDELPGLLEGAAPGSLLPYGMGRSYGDSCLNEGRELLDCSRLNRILSFDTEQGILLCESGVTLGDILSVVVPKGWFLAVTPGTQFVTVGGAIANDVHGKNHHRVGTFGGHVRRLGLLRSDRGFLECGPDKNIDWFRATVAGLGLTGVIVWAELQLRPIPGPRIDVETVPFRSLDEFLELSNESDAQFEYTVAWADCFAASTRGVFFRGNHSADTSQAPDNGAGPRVPFAFPGWVLNRWTLKAFNASYFAWHSFRKGKSVVPYGPFFYPLDSIDRWNLIYGKNGFLQYQFVIPEGSTGAFAHALELVRNAGMGLCLVVMKRFGAVESPGLLSFPRPGLTLTFDFQMRGERTLQLLDNLDIVVQESGGALYPAKDARMSPAMFRGSFPYLQAFLPYVDPAFSSSLWRRVTADL